MLLVGIMAKNGILIVEFADQLRDKGLNVREAIEEAANIRLRPVCMTMISRGPGRRAAGAGKRRGRRSPRGAWLGHRWRIGSCDHRHALCDALLPISLLGRFTKPKVEEEERLERELVRAEALEEKLK